MTRRALPAGLTALTFVLASLAGGCASHDTETLRPVSLPDLSRLETPVQDQVRERYASLMGSIEDRTPPDEIGTAYGQLGLILMAAGYPDVAVSCYLNAQALVPGDMRWPYYLGHLYRVAGDRAKATEFFTRALELRPTDLATLVWLGEMQLDQGQPEAAESFIQALSVEPASAAALAGVGRVALAERDFARAAEYLERALSVEPRASGLHYPLAMAYRGLGELGTAEAHLQQRGRGTARPPDPLMQAYDDLLQSKMAYEIRGMRAMEDGRWPEAEAAFRKGLELAPDDPSLLHRLGTALLMAGDARGAAEQFEDTLRRSPDFTKAHFGLGVILTMSGRHQEAIERFSAALEHQPNYLEARLGLAEALRVTGRLEESLPHFEQAVEIDPGYAEAWMVYAETLVRLGRYQEAREWLSEATQVHPDRPELADFLAQLIAAGPDE